MLPAIKPSQRMLRSSVLTLVPLLFASCAARIGPATIPAARFDYNQTISRSQNEQLLLNLVRLRYRDTPVFLDVGNVIASYSLSGNAGASTGFRIGEDDGVNVGINAGGAYSEQPTITYEPLRGSDFTQRLLTPLSPVTLVVLSDSGWSIERLLLCCVERINDISNAPSASGPTPSFIPNNDEFRELAALFRQLQIGGLLEFQADGNELLMRLGQPPPGDPAAQAMQRVREQLGLDPGTEVFRLTARRFPRAPGEISMTGRSLLGALFFLSHSVDAPAPHRQQGLVTQTAGPNNEPFDWTSITGGLLQIRSAAERPPGAFTAVRYRDYWFYIEDADLQSKATFNLVTYLFSLQAAAEGGASPLLTIPIGN